MAPMLLQASMIYTPPTFEVFQSEYEKHLAAYTFSSNGTNEFVIAVRGLGGTSSIEEERKVIVNPTDQMVSCSCRLFERIGILCRHALKGLDLMNIKLLPEKYILKRWTRDARSEIVQDMHGKDIVENPKLEWSLPPPSTSTWCPPVDLVAILAHRSRVSVVTGCNHWYVPTPSSSFVISPLDEF